MNFKNKRPRVSRAGCHLCKPHKILGNHKDRTKPKDRDEHKY